MPLSELKIETEYRSLLTDISGEFLIPALREAVQYDRAVGFFSSTILSNTSYGIEGLIKNGGRIRLVASPYLTDDDIAAIKAGYKQRDEVIKSVLHKEMKEPENEFEQERLNLLANLIKDGFLDIKIAFCDNDSQVGMYHEKLGLITDSCGNTIAFSGSMNETNTAINVNYEAIDVFRSWTNEFENERVNKKRNAFTAIWNDSEPGIEVISFPELNEVIIEKYKKSDIDYNTFETVFPPVPTILKKRKTHSELPCRPDKPPFYDYQEEAIDTWASHGFQGIFDMATGTGKTITALGSIVRISDEFHGKLAVIIVCPYQHLVEQWVEDLEKFNISPIIGYSESTQKNWKNRLESAIRNQKLSVRGKDFFCFICTNATYSSEYVQNTISKIRGKCLFVVDEAHNFGARYLSELLNENFQYRLALSATLDRYGDPTGTKKLYDYFGDKCISYDLGRAIKEKKLTRYKYYPIIVSLNDDELNKYSNISKSMQKCLVKAKDGTYKLNEKGKKLAMARSRIVAAAESKLQALLKKIGPYKDKYNILVYCGSASLPDYTRDKLEVYEEETRQIDAVTDMLGNKLGMRVSQFTSKENVEKRELLKSEFASGDNLQALIAIKCLDEGVNIPSIKTAFILASTTNPKEYIQRRGRVLRLAEGKEYAEIYDFITLPMPLGSSIYMTDESKNLTITMVKNELARAFEFARLADNYVESNAMLDDIREEYGIEEEDYSFVEEFDYYE